MDESLREMIEIARAGDKQAFATLVQRFQNRVFSVAYGIIGNQQDAEDLSQEIFIKAYKGIAKLNHAEGFYQWLLRIAVTTSISHKKNLNKTNYVPINDVSEPIYQGATPEEHVHKKVFKFWG